MNEFDDISEAVGELNKDFVQAGTNLVKEGTPFNRRTYVRTVFSALEASIHFMRQFALTRPKLFTSEEIEKLQEKPRLRFRDAVAFASEMFSRAMGSPFVLNTGGKEWGVFLKAIEVRDGITHPKRRASMDISDEEINAVYAAHQFVVGAMIQSLAEGSQKVEREVRELLEKQSP